MEIGVIKECLPRGYQPDASEYSYSSSSIPSLVLFSNVFETHWPSMHLPPSVKIVLAGRETYHLRGRKVVLGPRRVLVTNGESPYGTSTHGEMANRSIAFFFRPELLDSAFSSLSNPLQAIDDCGSFNPGKFRFVERSSTEDSVLLAEISRFLEVSGAKSESFWNCEPISHVDVRDSSLRWQTGLLDMSIALIKTQNRWLREADELPFKKKSTRLEIYQRVHRAKELIDGDPSSDMSLSALASEASLSPFHFARGFSRLFGISPHRYVQIKRLEKAAFLLTREDWSVTRIAMESGYSSLASFKLAFVGRYGCTPSGLRRGEISKV